MPISSITKILEKNKLLSNLSSEIISTISDISHGNPSIIWKIINHLKEEREVEFESILRSMRDNTLILSLLKACTHLQLVILKTASVIGEEFSTKVLKLVLPESIHPFVDEAMEVFSDNGFLINLDVGFYGFSSSLLRKMIYDIIPKRFLDTPLPLSPLSFDTAW
jgi:predicted ATPase